jgi:hypothetical protein
MDYCLFGRRDLFTGRDPGSRLNLNGGAFRVCVFGKRATEVGPPGVLENSTVQAYQE